MLYILRPAIACLFMLSTSVLAATDEMRCEKMMGTSLVDFKEALTKNCNLNKPFSSSLSKILNEEVYFYCCHKK